MTLSRQETVTVWDIGDRVPLRIEVRNNAGAFASPAGGLDAFLARPSGGDKEPVVMTPTSTGIFEGFIDVDESGDWWWSAATDGADADIPKMFEERTFSVRAQVVA